MREASPRLRAGVGGLFLALILVTTLVLGYDLWALRHPGDAYYLRTTFQELGDMTVGAPVKSGGIQIGQVIRLRLTPDNRIEGLLRVDPRYAIPDDSEAKVSTASIAGDAFLEIPFGKSQTPFPQVTDPVRAPVILMMRYVDISALMVMGNQLGAMFGQMTENVQGLIQMPELHHDIEELTETFAVLEAESKALNESFDEIMTQIRGLEWSGEAFGDQVRRAQIRITGAVDEIRGADGNNFTRLQDNADVIRDILFEEAPRIERIRNSIQESRDAIHVWIGRMQHPDTFLELLVSKDSPCSVSHTIEYGKQVFVTLLDESLFTKIGWLRVYGTIQNDFETRLHPGDTPLQVAEKWMAYTLEQVRRYGHIRDPYETYRER